MRHPHPRELWAIEFKYPGMDHWGLMIEKIWKRKQVADNEAVRLMLDPRNKGEYRVVRYTPE